MPVELKVPEPSPPAVRQGWGRTRRCYTSNSLLELVRIPSMFFMSRRTRDTARLPGAEGMHRLGGRVQLTHLSTPPKTVLLVIGLYILLTGCMYQGAVPVLPPDPHVRQILHIYTPLVSAKSGGFPLSKAVGRERANAFLPPMPLAPLG